MTPPILNIDAVELQPWGHGVPIAGAGEASDRYQARIGFLGRHLGAKKLGYKFGVLAEMPPGVDGKSRELRFVGRVGESLDYWQGE